MHQPNIPSELFLVEATIHYLESSHSWIVCACPTKEAAEAMVQKLKKRSGVRASWRAITFTDA